MSMQDPIADMLTRIRNATKVKKESVVFPYSTIKEKIVKKMLNEKFISGYKIIKSKKANVHNMIIVFLKYADNLSIITDLKRISKPSFHVYVDNKHIPNVLNGLGIAILSTSKGILTDKEAKNQNIGGEVIAYIW